MPELSATSATTVASDAVRNAREHVENIGLRAGTVAELTRVNDDVLHILSSELYDRSSHCILELLQNANDLQYGDVTPTLAFSYKPGYLLVHSNEIGFEPNNVEAISTIRRSTKQNKQQADGLIGEKGIGFKSVFGVADTVWITSRAYQFKFERDRPLGMITPVWEEFPVVTSPANTSFYFQLARACNQNDLVSALCEFDPKLLIFLKKIRRIETSGSTADGQSWQQTIHKTDEEEDGMSITVLTKGEVVRRYITTCYRVDDVPFEQRRMNYTYSDLTLAFDVSNLPSEPQYGSQNIHAVLPIRSYGLKFLLSGDFILTANRQSIDTTLRWNINLRDALIPAFIQTVDSFNGSRWRYFWPYFIPYESVSDDFFKHTRLEIVRKLRKKAILEACDGTLRMPTTLTFVDLTRYADESGEIFTSSVYTDVRYLSTKYPSWTIDRICSLGVSRLSDETFLKDLKGLIVTNPAAFQNKPQAWHSALARCLLSLAAKTEHTKFLTKLCIIPLADGTWTSASTKPSILVEPISLDTILKDCPIPIIHEKAATDISRASLFRIMGIESLTKAEVCQHICKMHASTSFRHENYTTAQLIAHARYLYEADWRTPGNVDLWFATTDGKWQRGSSIYITEGLEATPVIQRVFAELKDDLPVLHPDYFVEPFMVDHMPKASLSTYCFYDHESFSSLDPDVSDMLSLRPFRSFRRYGSAKWISFLIDNLHLSKAPRLFRREKNISTTSFNVCADFRLMCRKCNVSDSIHVLTKNWHAYCTSIDTIDPQVSAELLSKCKDQLLTSVKNIDIRTSQGLFPLQKTCLSGVDLLIDGQQISLPELCLGEGEVDGAKELLGTFGVAIKPDVQYYLKCLSHVRRQAKPDTDTISYIYQQLQNRFDTNEELLETFFDENPCIYATTGTRKLENTFWLTLDDCKKANIRLDDQYPESDKLFRYLLKSPCLDVTASIARLTRVNRATKLEDIQECLQEVSNGLSYMSNRSAAIAVKPLLDKEIFPVIKQREQCQRGFLLAAKDTKWFISDRPCFWESFAGVVPLLCFEHEALDKIEHILKAMRLDGRLLSKLVQSKTSPKGPLRLDTRKTKNLQVRTTYIESLISKSHPRRAAVVQQLKEVRVSIAAGVYQSFTLSHEEQQVAGHSCEAQVASSLAGGTLQVYLAESTLAAKRFPFELINVIANHCDIDQKSHLHLLPAILFESSITRIREVLGRAGVTLPRANRADEQSSTKIQSKKGNLLRMPSPRGSDSEDDFTTNQASVTVSLQNRQKKRDASYKATDDRRVPVMEIRTHENDFATDEYSQGMFYRGKHLDPYQNLQYLGENMTSQFLNDQLNSVYSPSRDWTSKLRQRSGLADHGDNDGSPFTLKRMYVSQAMTYFLVRQGHQELSRLLYSCVTYHIEVAASNGDRNAAFVANSSQLERIRKLRLSDQTGQDIKDIAVLIKISNLFSRPCFDIFIDPWYLFVGHQWMLQPGFYFRMRITDCSHTDFDMHLRQQPNKRDGGSYDIIENNLEACNSQSRERDFGFDIPITAEQGFCGSSAEQPAFCQSKSIYEPWIYNDGGELFSPWGEPEELNSISMTHTNPDNIDTVLHHTTPPWKDQKARATSRPSSSSIQDKGDIRSRSLAICDRPKSDDQIINTLWTDIQSNGTIRGLHYSPSKKYIYYRLGRDQIRLFMLFPGLTHEPLQGSIFTVCLEESISYKALSYTWGLASQPRQTLSTPEGRISIRESLFNALRWLRHRDDPLILWVDALCINQKDGDEKVQQIKHLANLFQKATCTLAFLGTDPDSNAAIETLLQIQAKDVCGSNTDDWPVALPAIPDSWSDRLLPRSDDPIWTQIDAFFDRAWFRRSWIVQEAIAAPTVQIICGKWAFDWADLFRAMAVIKREMDSTPRSWIPFLKLGEHRELEAQGIRLPLITLLEEFRHCRSELRRDRLFALLGLASDGNQKDFEPDYRADFGAAVLKFAKGMVFQRSLMTLLYRAGLGSHPDQFPSWIPDWTTEKGQSLSKSEDRGIVFNASGDTQECFKLSGKDVIDVEGYLLGEIEHVSKYSSLPRARRQYFREIDSMIEELSDTYRPAERSALKFRVPIAAAVHAPTTIPGDLDLQASYDAFRRILKKSNYGDSKEKHIYQSMSDNSGSSEVRHGSRQEKCSSYVALLDDTVLGWRFVTTKNKHCGIVPENTQDGDVVAVLCGGDVPFVLRKSALRQGMYRLVGECYLDGFMKGEVLKQKETEIVLIQLH